MSNALTTLTSKLATRLDMGDGNGLIETLKATAFKSGTQVSDAQMTALMVVANQYGLNPWTKEIYAFPDKGGIVPVVGVDGWSRIINQHPQFDGMDFAQNEESCTCIIYRKDRSHPIKVTEWMSECRRSNVGPWNSHPKRMLRHKSMIQCARIAFGYGGIYDQDEAERIVESIDATTGEITPRPTARAELPAYSQADFDKNAKSWMGAITSGRMSPDDLIAMVSTKGVLSDAQKSAIRDMAKPAADDVTDAVIKVEPAMSAAEQDAHDAFVNDMGE